ncbi:transcriptional regulator, XRE family [mine drainage metagenome]|uniref:Transcriptional regulator, XRE family n=1 Tax=mine drainage metagenome TaxID=410659 RepID=T0Y1G8_9ZZZZ
MLTRIITIHYMLRFKLKERIADKEFRDKKRIQLQEIAIAIGLNRMTLSKIANQHGANVQTAVLDKLCTYFECRIEELVEHLPDDQRDIVG